ncbi:MULTISPECIES: acetyl-CoA C-acetyltransferase [unclassified Pseudomonas]|uniref:acetyl-CoA C-acetyltransferase n=1 Tax=unclassified Pseudomonas TaxID=196821 RepID=UPI0008773E47|nr:MULTISPECIES: acetyl-CoA C-acetyltransferase [unclassified Pseudomonas]SCZ20746.1 acetyl-CoA C-acetyltransferase [Pseudomonas sp. NFACC44-2]SDA43842.1 acetyl-CoA C-acetyltransferase [Pseudomonas sp. NFACC51]SDY54877.1 acetyl-CoA C-acetyltransferase [Pseudomonas sp. NFACC08-1]SEI49261.1 acetyl-CoA C-acetyltransferase [Pseudomonas sp. NFACC07-1]SFH10066.1 acetyl-CoA C-acetyltransferase [Pseudomonas sp. NFACC54]
MSQAVFIYDAVRTPRGKGKKDGALYSVKPVHMAAGLLTELQQRYDLDTSRVDDVVLGCGQPVGEQGGDVAKCVVQYAGWDESVPGVQIDRFCASGLEAVNQAASRIASGWEDLIVAGGVESMSRLPMGAAGQAWIQDPEIAFKLQSVPQGIGADLLAALDGYSREDVDRFALVSQQRAAHARDSGYFDRSVVPVRDLNGLVVLERDEFIKPATTLEALSQLKPSFAAMGKLGYSDVALRKYPQVARIEPIHTAGNSSGIVDGASATLLGSERIGQQLGLTPRGRIVATAVLSTEPTLMLAGPGPAAKKALAKAGLSVQDIDLFEINEAFASVVLRFMRDLDISPEVTNVNGGAIALGHPIGATGAMLVGTVLDELERRNLKRGLIALCVGGGMGIATIIERL